MEITVPPPDAEVDLGSVDLFDAARYASACQHHVWQALRRTAPVWRQPAANGAGFWSLTRYADCSRVLRDSESFSSTSGTILTSVGVGDSAGGSTITLMDPPAHTAIRAPAMRVLGRAGVRAVLGTVRAEVPKITGRLLDDGGGDFATAMRSLPMAVFGDVLGVPAALRDGIARWALTSIAPDEPEFRGDATVEECVRNAHHELFALLTEGLRHSRRHPGNDLLTILSSMRIDGRPLGDRRVLLNCYSYVLGAHSTTPHVAAHTLLALIGRPDIWSMASRDPGLLPALVEEGVRWTSPTHHLVRRVARTTVVGGRTLSAGEWVCAWVSSANRDADVFEDPYSFRLDRQPNPHLGFGAGPHFCVGTHLSRAALEAVFESLFEKSISIEVAGEPRHLRSNWINGLTHLPVIIRRATT